MTANQNEVSNLIDQIYSIHAGVKIPEDVDTSIWGGDGGFPVENIDGEIIGYANTQPSFPQDIEFLALDGKVYTVSV